MVIAIDGPSGAGKGTVARKVAEALGYRHVDTGAMYRAVAWAAVERGIALDDEAAVATLADRARIDIDATRVAIDGIDITTAIRTPVVDRAASLVARLAAVRAILVAQQRAMAGDGNLVMEGRDIGTVVFPEAPVKIYLDADPAERARRRAHDPAHQSGSFSVAAVATALDERDKTDRSRATSPLSMAADAVHLDTTRMSIADAVARVLALVDARQRQA
ncbi:MAG: (d)CMP kinase [Vicinamibacteria bacterium]